MIRKILQFFCYCFWAFCLISGPAILRTAMEGQQEVIMLTGEEESSELLVLDQLEEKVFAETKFSMQSQGLLSVSPTETYRAGVRYELIREVICPPPEFSVA